MVRLECIVPGYSLGIMELPENLSNLVVRARREARAVQEQCDWSVRLIHESVELLAKVSKQIQSIQPGQRGRALHD